ncbi:MAG: hypothetical protein ACJ75I_02510 [Solirubrobacterales bacterium]
MNRYTFVIQVHDDGPSTLENLNTQELISLRDLDAVGPQIERWLAALHNTPSSTNGPTVISRPDQDRSRSPAPE